MYRRTTGRRWRRRDLRGILYEPLDQEVFEQTPRQVSPTTPVCPECGHPRPEDERVKAGLRCEFCEG